EVKPLAARPDAAALQRARAAMEKIAIEGAATLVLVDGVFVPELSDAAPPGVTVRSLSEALEGGIGDLLESGIKDAMISLNAALVTDGVVIGIADGATLSAP